jgi:LemA protein
MDYVKRMTSSRHNRWPPSGALRAQCWQRWHQAPRFAVLSLVAAALSACGYKSLQQQDEDVKTSWSEVVSQYQRRAELISGLTDSLKGFNARVPPSEQALIGTTAASARSGAQLAAPALLNDPAAFASYQALQERLTQSLRSLMGVTAAYPQLLSDSNFIDLRAQLAETEEHISDARRRYQDAVRTFNTTVRTFPTDLTARMFDFQPKPGLPSSSK